MGEGIVACYHNDKFFFAKVDNVTRPLGRCWTNCHVGFTPTHCSGEFVTVSVFMETHLYSPMGLVPTSQRSWEKPECGGMYCGDVQFATFNSYGLASSRESSARLGECGVGVRNHRSTRGSETYRTRQSFQKASADFALQHGNLARKGGLANVQLIGRHRK